MPEPWLALPAPAKVNLVLRVLGKRPDGYHEIETLFHALALHDLLLARRCPGASRLHLESRAGSGFAVPADADNLVLRAAAAFAAAVPGASGAEFVLRKRIPAGGGLGGGSSDAAAALRLLNALHGEPLPAAELHRLARGLGADVCFFLRGGTQVGRGIGDDLAPVPDFPGLAVLLLLLPFGTATAAVYKSCRAELTQGTAKDKKPSDNALGYKELAVPQGLANDLEEPAFRLQPELQRLFGLVAAHTAGVRMSGSGSTLFLAFPEREKERLARAQAKLAFLRHHGVVLHTTRSARGPWPLPPRRLPDAFQGLPEG